MYAVRTKKVASYGRRAQRYVAVSEDRRFGMSSKAETPTQLSDWSPPPPESIYSPSPVKVDQRKVSRKFIGKMGGKGTAVRRPLGTLSSNHQASPLVPPKATTSKKPYSSIGIGTPLSLRSPFVDVEISVIDDEGRKVSEEKRRTNIQPSFKATTQKPVRSPVKRPRKAIPIIIDSDDDSDSDFVLSPISKRTTKSVHVPPVDKRKSTRVQRVKKTQITQTPESVASISSPDIRPKSPMVVERKIVVSDSESDVKSELDSKKSMRKAAAVASQKRQIIKSSLTIANSPPQPTPTFPQTPCKVAPALDDHALPSTTATLTPFPLLKLQDHLMDNSAGLDANTRPLTPLKPSHSKFPSIFPTNFHEVDSDSSISLDLSIDLELELALKVAQVNLRDIPSKGRPRKVAVEKKPTVSGAAKNAKSSRSSGSSQLRPSLKKKVPSFLHPLLTECDQETPYDFQEFVEIFPFDQIHTNPNSQRTSLNPLPSYQKVGEASYSEVFGIGNVVLKIIPLMEEDCDIIDLRDSVDQPSLSEAKDVLKEIIVTRALGNICDGFTTLLRSYVIQGAYPKLFLSLWDEYNDRKGSESVRPDSFTSSQSYVVIILPHGGQDLETFTFDSDVCWQQASSVFWQVTKSLARAEELVHFEHRDLHWGQILISKPQRKRDAKDTSVSDVQATIIDLGLSRIDYVNKGNVADVCWTPFAEEIFEGEGEYQYDVYRMMREHNKNDWVQFNPLTNVMWLHYLCDKLIHRKNLKAPSLSSRSVATQLTRSSRKGVPDAASRKLELTAYNGLVAVESALGEVVRPFAQKTARKSKPSQGRKLAKNVTVEITEKLSLKSAQDVLRLAKPQGWTL